MSLSFLYGLALPTPVKTGSLRTLCKAKRKVILEVQELARFRVQANKNKVMMLKETPHTQKKTSD